MSSRRRAGAPFRYRLGLVAGACLVATGGYGLLKPAPGADDAALVPGAHLPRLPAAGPTPAVTAPPTAPVRVRIPRLGVDAPVRPVAVLAQGDLDVPEDPGVLGWWAGGAWLGEPNGSMVIDGHVDSARTGVGAFFWLRTLRPGDQVAVADGNGSEVRYVVTSRRQYLKSDLPAAAVFSPTVRARLVLITCGGRFDRSRRQYADNIVVYAVPGPMSGTDAHA